MEAPRDSQLFTNGEKSVLRAPKECSSQLPNGPCITTASPHHQNPLPPRQVPM